MRSSYRKNGFTNGFKMNGSFSHHSEAPDGPTIRRIEAVAIGASAGGVEAIGTLLAALPAGFGAAVVTVMHVPPNNNSALSSVLVRRCVLPLKEAEDKETIMPGRVYLAPPVYHLLVEPDKTFSLSSDEPVNYSRPSIDVMFESAALAYRENLLGIILTGANDDGAAGLKTIRACGGLAWVQDPADAMADSMPSAAIAQAGADVVLSLQELAQRLANVASSQSAIRRS
jgi:two-component system, chemotaxis family, protein-glutamate methylesterase/glutaminase